ncbi:MAG: HAMP domain-containing histidine kinase [Gammaproteobacteria bacterium]|nr:HAMP domain-containing histidine kinase [Gammaproteobacteria bacterium]
MIPLVSQVRRSLFVRLLLIFGITVILIFAIIYVSLQQLNQINNNQIVEIPDFFVRNIESIIDDIGTPPDLERAALLAQDLDWTIRIEHPDMVWRSDNDYRLAVELSEFDRALSGDAEIRRWNDEDIIVVNRDAYQFFMHQRSLISNDFSYVILYFGLAIAAIVLFLNYFTVNRLLAPVRLLKEGAEKIQKGDLSYRVYTQRQDELGELTKSVNLMADSLQSMLEAKRQLLMAISHELRTPITRAKLQLEFMDDGSIKDNLNDDIKEIDLLISDLLEAERLNNQHSALVEEPVEFSSFIESVVFGVIGYEGTITFQGPDSDEEVTLDKLRIRLLVTNLLNNAIRHGQGKPINVKVEFMTDTCTIEIIDQGEGIAAEHLDKITEPFYRADSARQRNTGGYGLGLYLCKLISEAHGGKIEIESELGKGTHITVSIPRHRSDSNNKS